MKHFVVIEVVASSILGVCFAGCGSSPTGVPVNGQVSFKGASVPNATLMFYPAESRAVTTTANDAGAYTVSLVPGDYTVTVLIGAILPPGWKEGDPVPPPKIALPPQYASRTKSPLKATVAAGQTEPIDFELK